MRQYLQHETSSYSLHSDQFGGYTLKRRADGASAYFQGDDARLWSRNIEAILDVYEKGGFKDEPGLDRSFDFLCSGYDDVLEVVE
jgi:hypothetical protein